MDATLLTTRTWLESLGPGQQEADVPLTEEHVDRYTTTRDSVFGPMRHAVHPGEIEGVPAIWDIGPTTPGADDLAWR